MLRALRLQTSRGGPRSNNKKARVPSGTVDKTINQCGARAGKKKRVIFLGEPKAERERERERQNGEVLETTQSKDTFY